MTIEVIEIPIPAEPEVIEVTTPSGPAVIEVQVPGQPGPKGQDGEGALDDLPDLTLIFNNGIV
ncbi:hypothetical protein BA190_10210 [Labrys sp. WJW]|uniref:hypothetical protein n=1 Tax=Labrys sp. WJW TaxID=1737983 RepID=UPI000837886A|nr:hypothetical protein [Labrys sp. WJW]OCC05267.1 hypothetical protein BA190_10210 [Labrys sp. WJW]